jgi:hypothetical protein
MNIKGERLLRTKYTVGAMGGSVRITLHPDLGLMVRDVVQFSMLPDGTARIRKVGKKAKRHGR